MGLNGMKCAPYQLENIDENGRANWLPSSVHPPETPTESMQFLARSWSVSATELSKALSTTHDGPKHAEDPTFSFLGEELTRAYPAPKKDFQVEPLRNVESPPVSPRGSDDAKELFLLHQELHLEFLSNQQLLKNGLYKSIKKGKTTGKRLKDQKERKKHEIRIQNAQLHAAISVAGVAAAVAALTASNASAAEKTPSAIASAAALVASHCIEIAEDKGADHDQILTAVNSAINAKTNGDIMTLTAGAATALRGAATLKARLQKGYGHAPMLALGEETVEEGRDLTSMNAMNYVLQGGELLKRTRNGALHWKEVSYGISSAAQVVVKLKSRHMAGTFTKKKIFPVYGVYSDIPAWPGRERGENSEQRAYFGIETTDRVIEFECKNKGEKQMWIEGIHHLLNCRINTPLP